MSPLPDEHPVPDPPPDTTPVLVCCGKFEWRHPEGYVCCLQFVKPEDEPRPN